MEPRWWARPVHETEERRACPGIGLDLDGLMVALYTSPLSAENTGPSHHAGMLKPPPWQLAQAAGCMTWTHDERKVLPSRLSEEALPQGMHAPHHLNCGNVLSKVHTSVDGDDLKPAIYLLWDDSVPIFDTNV